MMVGTYDRGVNEQMLHVGIAPQGRGHTRPNAFLAPTGEAYECSMPMPEFGREITPRATGTHDPENSLDETPIVFGRAARIACLAWQNFFNALPLVIAQHLPVHPVSAQKSGYDHTPFPVNIDGRPHFAKLSIDDGEQVKIAVIDPDFDQGHSPCP